MVLLSCKPSCTSDQGSLRYAGLRLSIRYLFFLWWLSFRVTLRDYIYSDGTIYTVLPCKLTYETNEKKEIYISTSKYIFIPELGSAGLKVTARVAR